MVDAFRTVVAEGGMIVGICNGFQVLVQLGLVPNTGGRCEPEASLLPNASGRFEDRWVRLRANAKAPIRLWDRENLLEVPVRHGQGRLAFRDDDVRSAVARQSLGIFSYCDARGEPTSQYPENPNGSDLAIAGLCDPSGRVVGMMPHPEDHLSAFVHPDWPRRRTAGEGEDEDGDGVSVFRAVVRHVARDKRLS